MNLKTWRLGVLALAVVSPFPVFAETLTIDETSTPIRVDGHLTDWPSARMILLNEKSQLTLGKSHWKNEDDLSGRVFITYDEKYLYLSVIVLKKTSVVNSNDKYSLWNGDCLELFLSTDIASRDRKRLSRGDYHIGLSPGTDCKDARMYCFNKNRDIQGGRVVARKAKSGYVLEACVPLVFFEGLELGPGKTAGFNLALSEGGFAGNRVSQLDLSGNPAAWENPGSWGTVQWTGKTSVSVPVETRENLFAGMVRDGTKGAIFVGRRTVTGTVTDAKGKPLAGARVSTWPKTKEAVADGQGNFKLEQIKVYDKTVFYGRKDGYAASLAPFKGPSLSIQLWPLPFGAEGKEGETGDFFFGPDLGNGRAGNWDKMPAEVRDRVKSAEPRVMRFGDEVFLGMSTEATANYLDLLAAAAREMGSELVLEVPPARFMSPDQAAKWVKYCNVEKKHKVRFWVIGHEPDLYDAQNADSLVKHYDIYHYINDFRETYNAMKRADPSLFIMGPELAWKYSGMDEDWLTPFLRYNGDIVNMVSLHHYASLTPALCTPRAVLDDLRRQTVLFRNLRSKVLENTDVLIPLVLTGGNTCAKPFASKEDDDAGPDSFWSALWAADTMGLCLNERIGMGLFSLFAGEGSVSPAHWALRVFGRGMGGKVVTVQVRDPNISAYALQDAKTRDVTLLLVNKGDRYQRLKISLNGGLSDLSVEAGLDQRYDLEIPYFSIASLELKADRKPGEVVLYTRKMAKEGKEPQATVIKPW